VGAGGCLSGAHSVRLPFNGCGTLFPGIKRPDCDAEDILPFYGDFKEAGNYTSTHPYMYAFMALLSL
jgi:hypothetical protein